MSLNMCGWIVFVLTLLTLMKPSCSNSDNLALLASTLKTMQRAACDDEMVALACPKGTSISIQVAQYGKAAPQSHICMADNVNDGEKCLWPNSMQYSLLQTVVEACQKKPQCKFSTKPKPGLVDPCPLARKFVEVAYKCRPSMFRSRTGCAGEVIRLSCNPHSRIAIFEAQFGRLAYESTCPQRPGEVDETCITPRTTEVVMHTCHGKRRCQISAHPRIFTHYACKKSTSPYLKVIYACVPLGVLSEKFESAAEQDELSGSKPDEENLFDESEEESGEKWSETNVPLIEPPLLDNSDEVEVMTTQHIVHQTPPHTTTEESYGFSNNYNQDTTVNSNKKLYIYISVALLVLLLIICILIGGRYYYLRQSRDDSKTGDMFRTDPPNVFNDVISDIDSNIDNDIDVAHMSGTFCEHPDMILYGPGGKGTLRAMKPLSTIYPCSGVSMYGNVDYVPSVSRIDSGRFSRFKESIDLDSEIMVSPKSLKELSNSQFFYG